MKVLLLNQIPEVNNKYTFSLAKGLRKKNIDVEVCGIEDDDVALYTDIKYVPIFYNYSREKNPLAKIWSYQKSWDRLLNYCINNQMNVLHVQWYIFSPIDYIYHRRIQKHGIKVVSTIHDLLPFNRKFYDRTYHKKIYQNADWVINQARANTEILLHEYGVSSNRLTYIPHGHYMEFAEPATSRNSREYLSIPADKSVILFFGQIKKVKGVDVLIKAMEQVVAEHPNVQCVIAGKVWKDDLSVYQQLIEEKRLSDHIRLDIKYIPDEEIKYYFNAADIVALPYRQIYQSGVVLLAYAYARPVVATREGEFLTVIKDKETGLLVPSGSISELAEAIKWYLRHPDIAEEFGKKGKADLMDRLSWDKIAQNISTIYENVC